MPRLISISWKKFEKFLLRIGCVFERQESSHRVYSKKGLSRPIILPAYKNLPVFIIKNNLRTLGISPQQYLDILDKI